MVTSGTLLIAASCAMMAGALRWPAGTPRLLTGIGMRLSLYDALFAAVVNLYGQQARKTISHITLAGGLASALFWPLGEALLTIMPLAECSADLCAVWPAERMAELSTASPAAQFSGEITSLASDSRGRPA